MALVGLSMGGTEVYESKLDPAKGTEHATKFTLGTLDVFITGIITDKAVSFKQTAEGEAAGIEFNNAIVSIEAVRFGLKGWSNFKDLQGNDIPFKTSKRNVHGRDYVVVSDESLKALDLDLVKELAERLRKMNTVTRSAEGNSGEASSPSSSSPSEAAPAAPLLADASGVATL